MPNILKFNIYPNFSREFIKGAMRNLIRDENIKDEDAEKVFTNDICEQIRQLTENDIL